MEGRRHAGVDVGTPGPGTGHVTFFVATVQRVIGSKKRCELRDTSYYDTKEYSFWTAYVSLSLVCEK